jgi:SAM-dependent methyltransferase
MQSLAILWAKITLTQSLRGKPKYRARWGQTTKELYDQIEASKPYMLPYERLADVWHDCAASCTPDYASFLLRLAKAYRLPMGSILELACGSGTVTIHLAQIANQVVGLDRSASMLKRAKVVCEGLENVRFIEGDFRSFNLGERFDAVVCASDSLNYLSRAGELIRVFERVAEHLNPGGLFVFDVVNDWSCRMVAGRTSYHQKGETSWALCHEYDRRDRVAESFAVFDSGVEMHRRIAIDPRDVFVAVRRSSLTVIDHFSNAGLGVLPWSGYRDFYVLTRREFTAPARVS